MVELGKQYVAQKITLEMVKHEKDKFLKEATGRAASRKRPAAASGSGDAAAAVSPDLAKGSQSSSESSSSSEEDEEDEDEEEDAEEGEVTEGVFEVLYYMVFIPYKTILNTILYRPPVTTAARATVTATATVSRRSAGL